MGLPLSYSFRNLQRRKVRTGLTMLAVALVAAISVVMFAFSAGLIRAARNSGSPDNIIVIDRKAANQGFSKVSERDYALLQSLPQIKKDAQGNPLISPEAVQQTRVTLGEHKNRPGTIRGVTPRVFDVATTLRLTQGNRFAPGRKVMVGELAHTAMGVPPEALSPGATLEFQNETWTVVGMFSTGGTALDSEILADLGDVMAVYVRDSYSTALIKLERESDVSVLIHALNNRNDIQVKAIGEVEYYRGLSEGYERIIYLAVGMALIAAVGGLVSGMNTMYASVLGRIREIATLKVMGFRRPQIIWSFIAESVFIVLPGALAGCAVAMLADGLATKFSSGAFEIRVDAWALGAGVAVALFIGVAGALPPAIKGTRMKTTDALQYA